MPRPPNWPTAVAAIPTELHYGGEAVEQLRPQGRTAGVAVATVDGRLRIDAFAHAAGRRLAAFHASPAQIWNIEDLRHRVMDAIEADSAVYWADLLASDVFERYEQTLMLQHPDIFSEVADAYRAAHAINQRVPQARLGTPIPATEIPWLRGKVDGEMRHASQLLRGKIPRRSDQDSSQPGPSPGRSLFSVGPR